MNTADAIVRTLEASDEYDNHIEGCNVADMIGKLSDSAHEIANAITPTAAVAGRDETGGVITSLTEAMMGITAGLVRIANAIEELAGAVREHGSEDRE